MDKKLLAEQLKSFLTGNVEPYEFDDLVAAPFKESALEHYRQEIISLPERFPPETAGSYTSESGLDRLREIVSELSNGDSALGNSVEKPR